MKIINKVTFLLLFLFLITKGSCGCSPGNVVIDQQLTGEKISNLPVWNVTISNKCSCTLTRVRVSCVGFESVADINPLEICKKEDICLANNGGPIHGNNSFTFTYAWSNKIAFAPYAFQEHCS
ncbi:hypothetical protein C2S52_016427 [Perilla frutescens var. hirtella]|nr:hypothetical protein C2S52_016427 [Perilla frutescens var. hirtella]